MRLLLDTQAFLWFVADDPRLGPGARAAIELAGNQRFLSLVSIWEMAIKHSVGKLSFTEPFDLFVSRQAAVNSMEILPVNLEHVLAVANLPLHHRDPFDRLLVVQALAEQMTLVSSDGALDAYGVAKIW